MLTVARDMPDNVQMPVLFKMAAEFSGGKLYISQQTGFINHVFIQRMGAEQLNSILATKLYGAL